MIKTGLYFGSFNPVHIGHTAIAGFMTEYAGLDEVWFVVSPHNPLKKKETLLADRDRLYLVQLALGENDKLKTSDIEFSLPAPSYTIDTLTHLKEKYKNREYSLVMGEDNLYTLHKWKNARELVSQYPIYVYPRPGTEKPGNPVLADIISKADIHMVDAPLMEISSTFIREGIHSGKDLSFLLHPPVWKYIKEMHFFEKQKLY
jgi:nicotinate-nucleotide adenylyltransferase